MNEQDIQQLKAKYKELGETIERLEKGEVEFKPLTHGYCTESDGRVGIGFTNRPVDWNLMPTEAEAKRLGKIFQAVAEQEHLVKFVNGDWTWELGVCCNEIYLSIDRNLLSNKTVSPCPGTPVFRDNTALELAIKLASPNLLAYWKREL